METTEEREAGIAAIVMLQALGGTVETREQAEEGWDSMNQHEKDWTMTVAAADLKK